MSDNDQFNNPKPNKQYKPTIGDFKLPDVTRRGRGAPETYADLGGLLRGLEKLINEINSFQSTLEKKLKKYALSIAAEDQKLISSNVAEWPIERLGAPKPYITYDFYKALRFRTTTSAAYIRKRYEEGARDVTGTSALDFLHLTSLIRDEATLIQEFLNVYLGNVNDVAEFRTIEQFQDWLLAAVGYERQFRAFYEKGETNPQFVLPTEIQRTTSEEAKQGQALFKLKLNAKNDIIERDLEFLKRNFSEYASTFYTQYLGPALKFRLHVSSRSLPIGSNLNKAISESSNQMDILLSSALTDQRRRRVLFESKMDTIFSAVRERDTYRSYINQLSVKGREMPVSGPAVMIEGREPTDAEVDFFREAEYQEELPQAGFSPPHSALSGLDANDHDQYLLRDGGNVISGHITMEEGTTFDGMRPSQHRHTGEDGTPQIHGADIIDGTLGDNVVDPTLKPPSPTDLRVVSYDEIITPPGAVAIDVTVEWRGLPHYTYEVQLTRTGVQIT